MITGAFHFALPLDASLDMVHHQLLLVRRCNVCDLKTLCFHLLPCPESCFWIGHLALRTILDCEDSIDLVERQAFCFRIEQPDDWNKGGISGSKDDVESPSNVLDT